VYHDFLRDLDGKGWHLDRARFESWLCANAKLRGACLLTNSRVAIISRRADGWEAVLHRNDDVLRVHARAMIDASGRNAAIARQLGARRRRGDKLICAWIYGDDRLASAELSHVEAEENGWWYSAPLPGRRRVLAFHTDADLAVAKAARTDGWLYEQAARLPGLGAVLDGAQFAPDSAVRLTAAHSSETVAPSGPGWLAVGDASLSFDPLSAQGLFHSLYTGLLGAEACYRGLVGESNAWNGYAEEIGVIASAYRGHLGQWYGAEQRWSEAPFWRRRQDLTSSHPATLV
jgi:flavin-dependent dehydrogenase